MALSMPPCSGQETKESDVYKLVLAVTGNHDFVLKHKGRWDRYQNADDLDPCLRWTGRYKRNLA